jgi:2-polyprenyl-3-methyl-5-hydroxy-6-metoxy-1,4-benzoquinol methylase
VPLHAKLKDRLFAAPGRWNLSQCPAPGCGLIWLDPEPAADEIPGLYGSYYTHQFRPDAAGIFRRAVGRAYSAFLDLTRVGGERRRLRSVYLPFASGKTLLELGCGSGERLARLVELGWEVTGQEVDPTAAEGAARRTGVRVHVGPVEDLVAAGRRFDAVVMNHVIEHVLEPVALLASCRRLLAPDGDLISVTPNSRSWGYRQFGKDWLFLDPPRHIVLFNPDTLQRAARNAGFERISVWSTCANAQAVAEGSLKIASSGRHDMTHRLDLRTEWRAFLLQLEALRAFRADSMSGDELVIRCRV